MNQIELSEDVRRSANRFRIVVSLILVLTIWWMWRWTARHSDDHAELESATVSPFETSKHAAAGARGFLGVVVQPVTPAIARAFDLEQARGALVGDVSPGTPAARAGLEEGDVILEIAGEPVEDSRDLQLKIAQTKPSSEVTLSVIREDHQRDLTVKLDELPSEPGGAEAGATGGEVPPGISLKILTPVIARQLDLVAHLRGVVVATVEPGTIWSEAGLRRGDLIEEINRKNVADPRDFDQALKRAGDEPVLVLVNRGGTTTFVVVELY